MNRESRWWGASVVAFSLWMGLCSTHAVAQESGATVRGTVRVPSFLREDRTEPDVTVMLVDASSATTCPTCPSTFA